MAEFCIKVWKSPHIAYACSAARLFDLWWGYQDYAMEKGESFQYMISEKLYSHEKKSEVAPLQHLQNQLVKLKCIKHLNIRLEIVKLLEENREKSVWALAILS